MKTIFGAIFAFLAGFGIIGYIALIFFLIFGGIWLWPYSLNSWLVYFHRDPVVVWWQGLLLGIFPLTAGLTFPVAILTWIAMLFLG